MALQQTKSKEKTRASELALAYIGAVVPDRAPYNGKAFSRAGNMAQLGLLHGLAAAGVAPAIILTQRPLQAFPGSRTIYATKKLTQLEPGLSAELIPFFNMPVIRPIVVGSYVFLALIRWAWRMNEASNKIILTFNLTEPAGVFTLLAARLIRARAVAWINDINVPGQTVSNNWMRRLDFWLQNKLLPRFDGLVVVNEEIVNDFAPKQRFVCVDGGVRSEMLLDSEVEPTRKKERTFFTIVAAGSLDDQNGIIEILKAFSLLKEPFYRLRIAGSGPLKARVQEAELKDSRIEYCGYLSHDQVRELYRSADVLINMRLTERVKTPYFFPSKLLEYMASGVPVITTCTGHVEKRYGDLVFMLRNETAEGLAEMVRFVAGLDDEQRCRRGAIAREYMRLHGTWEARAKIILGFVHHLGKVEL